jgi:hypothetical protein
MSEFLWRLVLPWIGLWFLLSLGAGAIFAMVFGRWERGSKSYTVTSESNDA